jgi:hypothetical protein
VARAHAGAPKWALARVGGERLYAPARDAVRRTLERPRRGGACPSARESSRSVARGRSAAVFRLVGILHGNSPTSSNALGTTAHLHVDARQFTGPSPCQDLDDACVAHARTSRPSSRVVSPAPVRPLFTGRRATCSSTAAHDRRSLVAKRTLGRAAPHHGSRALHTMFAPRPARVLFRRALGRTALIRDATDPLSHSGGSTRPSASLRPRCTPASRASARAPSHRSETFTPCDSLDSPS